MCSGERVRAWCQKVPKKDAKAFKESNKELIRDDLNVNVIDEYVYFPLRECHEGAVEEDFSQKQVQPRFSFEHYGQVVIIKRDQDKQLALKMLSPKLLLVNHRTKDDGLRSPDQITLFSDPTFVGYAECLQNGITCRWNPLKTMFCPGNISEKLRLARLSMRGERVLDLFAGIGYWTLPALVHCGVEHVTAVDWNPESIKYLKINLQLNRVSDRCTVIEGDCTKQAFKPVFDRVILGLLPSSQCAWKIAFSALKNGHTPTFLHIHENVKEGEEEEVKRLIIDTLPSENVAIQSVTRVKSYAPRIWHCVFDVKVIK